MTDTPKELITVKDADGNDVQVPRDLVFGSDKPPEPVPFIVNGELFWAVAKVPVNDYGRLTSLLANMPKSEGEAEKLTPEQAAVMIQSVIEMAELILQEESATRIAERMGDKKHPLDVKELMESVTGLINHQYSKSEADDERPTNPTSD